jgi:hypothetical protein
MSAVDDGTAGSSVNASGLSRAERVRAQSAKGSRNNRAYNEAYQLSRKWLLILTFFYSTLLLPFSAKRIIAAD